MSYPKDYRLANQMNIKKYSFLIYVLLATVITTAFFSSLKETPSTNIAGATTTQTISSSLGDYFGDSKDETVSPASEDVTYHIETSEISYTAYEVAGHELSEPIHLEANEEYFITLVFSEDEESFKEIVIKSPTTGEIERIPFVKPIKSEFTS